MAAEVVAATARRRWPAWQQRWQLGGSTILVEAAARLEVWQQCGGGSGNNGVFAVAAWHMLTIILIVTMMMMIDY